MNGADVECLDGLTGSVRVATDQWGIAHIYGNTLNDVLFGQGFNAARERLWQMDYWRRCGLGRLAAVLGGAFVERDRAARLFLYRGNMQAEWAAYGPQARDGLLAYTQGINAFIDRALQDPALLAPEFRALDYLPERWDASDIMRIRSHGLYFNVRDELARARILRDFNPELEELRRRREPARALHVPPGLDVSVIPDDVLAVYDLAVRPPVVTAQGQPPLAQAPGPEGSNNWVIAGSRTQSGRPILANDPHRIMTSLPSMRYLVHLSTPDFDAIGGSELALPGLMNGHNGHMAFGITYFNADQEDLYVYELNPDNPGEYRYGDGWEGIRQVQEHIPVRGGEPVVCDLAFTRHGPVIHLDAQAGLGVALRASWLETGAAPYLGGQTVMRARSWDAFRQACTHWRGPCSNLVYADTEGNIGWQVAGLIPRRPNWDGLLPVPGDGRYEWQGYFTVDELPGAFNPERGWLATSNELNLPPGYPPERHLGYEWYSRLRRQRVDEVLGASTQHTLAGSNALQSDACSLLARHVIACIRTLPINNPHDHPGLALLLQWDAMMHAGSAAGALFEVWFSRFFRPRLFRQAIGQIVPAHQVEDALRAIASFDTIPDTRVALDLLENPGARLGPQAQAWLARAVIETLDEAVAALRKRLGESMQDWSWGALHTARMSHPLRALLRGKLPDAQLATPRIARPGSGDTVGMGAYAPDFTQFVGSTLRVVVDVGEWDQSLAMNAPGQSGRLDSPFAGNLLDAWAQGGSIPLLYSQEAVARATRAQYWLRPGPA